MASTGSCRMRHGFVYCVSITGITGTKGAMTRDVARRGGESACAKHTRSSGRRRVRRCSDGCASRGRSRRCRRRRRGRLGDRRSGSRIEPDRRPRPSPRRFWCVAVAGFRGRARGRPSARPPGRRSGRRCAETERFAMNWLTNFVRPEAPPPLWARVTRCPRTSWRQVPAVAPQMNFPPRPRSRDLCMSAQHCGHHMRLDRRPPSSS